jgi:hypothetical protein
MQEFLLESPWMLGFAGIAVSLACLIAWSQLGQRWLLLMIGIFVVLTCLAIMLSLWIETDRERIRLLIHSSADDLKHGRLARVRALVHPQASPSVQRIQSELERYRFDDVRITAVHEIESVPGHHPPKIVAQLNAAVEGSVQHFHGKGVRLIKLTFLKSGDKWLVQDLEHDDPLAYMRRRSTSP